MPDSHRAVLRVDPETIPQLRELFRECLELVGETVASLRLGGRMIDPWMYDPVSVRMRDVYNATVMDAPDGGYAALRAYQAELQRTYEELGRMEARYRAAEDATTDLFDDRT